MSLVMVFILGQVVLCLVLASPGESYKSYNNTWARSPETFMPYFFGRGDRYTSAFGHFPEELRLRMLEETRKMFTFGYDSYIKYAFPLDELDPIHCSGRGPDYANPSNININDVLGDYSLTLIDVLDTLAIMGNKTEFQNAVKLVVDNVSFDTPNTVQVFEANIRILGGLLSAHLLMEDATGPYKDYVPDWYMGDLLTLAHDLADRLLSAFERTSSGLPHPRVNLRHGLPDNPIMESCTAGAGSLVLEFGVISRLLGDPIYETYARKAINALWKLRDHKTGLLGNVMNINTGNWVSKVNKLIGSNQISGLGAGMDSFYEYLLKSYIMFQEEADITMFKELYSSVRQFMRRGRADCLGGDGPHPLYVNVDMTNGDTATNWVDSLQAAFPGVQVLNGDVDEAICQHLYYYAIWRRYGCLPERFNWKLLAPDVKFYPLRPEFVESTYLLYQATKNPFYLHVGKDILTSLNAHTRAECGYATVHNVDDMSLEDRQESFFLSETCKYLYLLFDVDNPVNLSSEKYLFTTEGHVFPISDHLRRKMWLDPNGSTKDEFLPKADIQNVRNASESSSCPNLFDRVSSYSLPLQGRYISQLFSQLGVDF